MRTFALVLFAAVAVIVSSVGKPAAAAPVPKHLMKEPETDKAKLQGKWKLQSLKLGEMELGPDLIGTLEMVFELRGDTLTATVNAAGTVQKSTATVKYPAAGGTGPKRISMTDAKTVDQNGKAVNNGGKKDDSFTYTI